MCELGASACLKLESSSSLLCLVLLGVPFPSALVMIGQ